LRVVCGIPAQELKLSFPPLISKAMPFAEKKDAARSGEE
jgi:hypothetical protein